MAGSTSTHLGRPFTVYTPKYKMLSDTIISCGLPPKIERITHRKFRRLTDSHHFILNFSNLKKHQASDNHSYKPSIGPPQELNHLQCAHRELSEQDVVFVMTRARFSMAGRCFKVQLKTENIIQHPPR